MVEPLLGDRISFASLSRKQIHTARASPRRSVFVAFVAVYLPRAGRGEVIRNKNLAPKKLAKKA
jgi:hypothetical protein